MVSVPVEGQAAAETAVYPSSLNAEKLRAEPVSPFACLTAHSFASDARVFAAAEALALLLIEVKAGIAIAERIANTATTTTSSINEKPASPGLLLRTLQVLEFCR